VPIREDVLRASGLLVAALATATLVSPVAATEDGTDEAPSSSVFMATVTGYANGADGGAVGSTTATGTQTHWGTVAADWALYPPGTRLQIEGFDDMVFVVEDRGSAVRGQVIDVWFPDLGAARAFGTQKRLVNVLPP
jgi:3D (Asp-Asp-Asp) domain-containing protein